MNIDYLKNKNIHFIECEDWKNVYGYEKMQMKEDTINYIEQLQQENQQLKAELECTIGIVEHNRIINKKNREIQQLKIQIFAEKKKYAIKDKETQQKEFIKYLEDEIKELQKIKETELDYDLLQDVISQLLAFEDVFQKYKSITGENDV